MAEAPVRFDLITELINTCTAHKTQFSSAVVSVNLTETSIVVGLTDKVGNLSVATQFTVNL